MNYDSNTVRPQVILSSEEEIKVEEEISEQEGHQVKLRVVGKPPSQRELEEHMATHLPFRNWCTHCISGRAQSDAHRKQLRNHEEEVPTISIDYAFLGDKDGREGAEDKLQPMIVLKDRRSGTIKAHLVEEKGVNAYAIKRVGQDIGLLGYRKFIFKSDNEPAIRALKEAIKNERQEEIIMEESPVGESASNGEVEAAIKQVEGMFRSIKSGLEERLNRRGCSLVS